MRILLVNPWIVDFKAYDEWMRPLPLYRFIEKHSSSHEVHLIDCMDSICKEKKYSTGDYRSEILRRPEIFNHIPRKFKRYGISVESFRKQLEDFGKPDVAGITSLMTYWYPGYRLAAEEVRRMWPEVPVILGGLYPQLMPGHAASIPGIKIYDGKNFTFKDGPEKYLLAKEVRHVLPLRLYEGCPFKCEYCASGYIHGNKMAAIPLRQNLDRLDAYVLSGGMDIVFCDDALLFEFDLMFGKFLEHILGRKYAVRLHMPNGLHARYITERNAEKMHAAGVKTIRLGYEKHGKTAKTDAADLARAIKCLRVAGFNGKDIGVYLLAGPEPGLAREREGAVFIHSLGAKVFLNLYSPVPGSALFEEKAKKHPDLLTEPLFHNDASYIFTHEGMPWEDVQTLKTHIKELNRSINGPFNE